MNDLTITIKMDEYKALIESQIKLGFVGTIIRTSDRYDLPENLKKFLGINEEVEE